MKFLLFLLQFLRDGTQVVIGEGVQDLLFLLNTCMAEKSLSDRVAWNASLILAHPVHNQVSLRAVKWCPERCRLVPVLNLDVELMRGHEWISHVGIATSLEAFDGAVSIDLAMLV